jgi:U32 family peptidase
MYKNKLYSIAAPICTVEEIEPLFKIGANEVYFGIMTEKWKAKYGDAEFISRRQSEHAHISTYNQLSSILKLLSDFNGTGTLVLNANYSEEQMPYILEIISEWEVRGGHAVMVSDLGILLQMIEQNSKLTRYMSVMAGVFNHESVAFFQQLRVSRIVLPREMKLKEMYLLIRNTTISIEFEAITMFQKCQYIDSFCNFIHVVDNSSSPPDRNKHGNNLLPLSHGCILPFKYNGKIVVPLHKSDNNTPYCAACQLSGMLENGIRHFKIAGRGYPPQLILKAVAFTKNTLDHFCSPNYKIHDEYKKVFGESCGDKFCYYS